MIWQISSYTIQEKSPGLLACKMSVIVPISLNRVGWDNYIQSISQVRHVLKHSKMREVSITILIPG